MVETSMQKHLWPWGLKTEKRLKSLTFRNVEEGFSAGLKLWPLSRAASGWCCYLSKEGTEKVALQRLENSDLDSTAATVRKSKCQKEALVGWCTQNRKQREEQAFHLPEHLQLSGPGESQLAKQRSICILSPSITKQNTEEKFGSKRQEIT